MLKTLKINNFTVFGEADLQFSPGLNVIVGENGTGKSHLLKLGYAVLRCLKDLGGEPSHLKLSELVYHNLKDVFKLDDVYSLYRNKGDNGVLSSQISWGEKGSLEFSFNIDNMATTEIALTPSQRILDQSVYNCIEIKSFTYEKPSNILFIPTKEILSIYYGFRSALRNRELAFDATYLDLAESLDFTPLANERFEKIKQYVVAIEKTIGKFVSMQNGKFRFEEFSIEQNNDKQRVVVSSGLEANIVAEGHRKLGMLAYLIQNGSLGEGSSLFWDEPEANLNPKLLKALAEILVELSKVMQITIATHSLFLLRELEILQEEKKLKDARYFGLHLTDDGVTVQQGDTSNDIGDIVALEESLLQSTRYLDLGEDM